MYASSTQRVQRTSGGLYNLPGKSEGALGQNPDVFHNAVHLGRCTIDVHLVHQPGND